jgi:hypothetical protein
MKKLIARGATLAVVAVTALCGTPAAFAQGSSSATVMISNTGPNSNNTVAINNTNTCTVTNTNPVTINASSNQQASTGNVNVSGNTTAGSSWGQWDPDAWAAQGYTYDQWYAALSAHLGEIQANWGKQKPGTISSGNASNSNSVNASVAIANKGCSPDGTAPVNPDGPTPSNPQVLGDATARGGSTGTGSGTASNVLGISNPHATGGAGAGGSSPNTPGIPGAPVSPSAGGCSASIGTTGPSSNNQIACNSTVTNNTTNNNMVTGTSSNSQGAGSGSVNESSNTTTGGGGSGDSSNQNNSDFSFSVSN